VTSREALAAAVVGVPALAAVLVAVVPLRAVTRTAVAAALPAGGITLALATLALADPGNPTVGEWVVVDAAGGLLLAVAGGVGLTSVHASPAYLATARGHSPRTYFVLLYAFWALLLAVPLAGNLGAAWLLVEATTAPSALLVGFSAKARALEAGWKYLILTSLGLGVALLGIVLLAAGVPGGLGALSWQALGSYASGSETALLAYLLLLAGLAAKIGWAPVHNWLPDAHSEAPAPVSALLSAALLPSVLLVAWRSEHALAPVVGPETAQGVLIAFGLVSLAVAVPFLWRALAWKRLLAYSSLEHMGVIALGIGFGSPLALAGVAIHIVAHAVAKALGFYAATPLLGHDPRSAGHAATGIGRSQPVLAGAMGLSLGTLAAGFETGHTWAAAIATVLLALGFLGLVHALLDATAGKARRRTATPVPGLRSLTAFGAVSVPVLLGLAAAAFWLPGGELVDALARGVP
jgi:hydrogenase-4 component F